MKLSYSQLHDLLAACVANPVATPLTQRAKLLQSSQHTPAAVLIAIVLDEHGVWRILMTRRTERLRHHRGQIAFAGGKSDPSDRNPIHTALRETHEETGILPNVWQISGSLPVCFTPSGFAITPIVAWTAKLPEIYANADEVAEIFWLPLDFALDLKHYTIRENLPALPYLHYDIWGATALMLHHLAVCATSHGLSGERCGTT